MPLPRSFAHMTWVVSAALALFPPMATSARGQAPADPLLKLVPRDAALTVVVEDLRRHAKAFTGSTLSDGLRGLPAVRDWRASPRFRSFRQAMARAENVLGENMGTIRDELFGEAVVLTLRIPEGGRPEEARGLLLTRASNRALLDRLVRGLNVPTARNGDQWRVSERTRGGTTYHVRQARPGANGSEYHAVLGDQVFAWSNSEELIQGVIDRQAEAGEPGLAGLPEFQRFRRRLPGGAVASLFVEARFLERLMAAAPRSKKPGEERAAALLKRYLSAVRYVGAALEWRDGLILHTEEVIDPAALGTALTRWSARPGTPNPALRRVPATALMVATADLDFGVALDVLTALTAEKDRAKFENLRLALDGMLLGLEFRSDVVPRLGPGATAYLDRPGTGPDEGKPPVVFTAELDRGARGGEMVPAALDNALRTWLAVRALGGKAGAEQARVVSVPAGDHASGKVTALSQDTPFAYAVRDDRLVLGSSAEAVRRAIDAQDDPRGEEKFERVREVFSPGAASFACADLKTIHALADPRRVAIARRMAVRQNRPEADVSRDLDQALALIALFDTAFLVSRVEPDFTAVHRAFGLVTLPAAPGRP